MFFFLVWVFMVPSLCATKNGKAIIIDTDIMSDVDDVGALAIANILHSCGLADLRAVMVNTQSRYGALATNVCPCFASFLDGRLTNPRLSIVTLGMETSQSPR